MSSTTKIEWTEATWNPVTGCTRVSPGCANCYIERTPPFRIAKRRFLDLSCGANVPSRCIGSTTGVTLHPDRLDQPLHWRKPRRVFVNSLSDLFHDDVPDEFIAKVWRRMSVTPQHTYQILTKRPARMRALVPMLESWPGVKGSSWPLPNVWLGASVEDQERADLRIPKLLETPAAVRFLSCEPLLGAIDLRWWALPAPGHAVIKCAGCGIGRWYGDGPCATCGSGPPRKPIDWVIVGGESGPRARPMHPDWARGLRDQCIAARIPFFFKQWGEWAPDEIVPDSPHDRRGRAVAWPDEQAMVPVGKKRAGRELDGRTWDEFPAAVQG